MDASVAFVAESNQQEVTMSNSTFTENILLLKNELYTELVNCTELCYLNKYFRQFVILHMNSTQSLGNKSASITLIKSQLVIDDGCVIEN